MTVQTNIPAEVREQIEALGLDPEQVQVINVGVDDLAKAVEQPMEVSESMAADLSEGPTGHPIIDMLMGMAAAEDADEDGTEDLWSNDTRTVGQMLDEGETFEAIWYAGNEASAQVHTFKELLDNAELEKAAMMCKFVMGVTREQAIKLFDLTKQHIVEERVPSELLVTLRDGDMISGSEIMKIMEAMFTPSFFEQKVVSEAIRDAMGLVPNEG